MSASETGISSQRRQRPYQQSQQVPFNCRNAFSFKHPAPSFTAMSVISRSSSWKAQLTSARIFSTSIMKGKACMKFRLLSYLRYPLHFAASFPLPVEASSMLAQTTAKFCLSAEYARCLLAIHRVPFGALK